MSNYCKNCYELTEKLEAKEQECEELKDKLNCCFCNPYVELNDIEKRRKCVEVTECFRRQLDQLKTENDTLRQFLSKEPLALQALQSGYASYKKSSDVFYEMVKQYKQTLTEIKEIAENVQSFVDITLEDDVYTEMDKILQKISDCEVENEN